MTENEIATIVVEAAFKIHNTLGPGLFESVYEATLDYELTKRGLHTHQQIGFPVHYEGVKLKLGFRPDLIVENKVIVEIKSIDALGPIHRKQVIAYLCQLKLHLGLLINFNVPVVKDGIRRVICS